MSIDAHGAHSNTHTQTHISGQFNDRGDGGSVIAFGGHRKHQAGSNSSRFVDLGDKAFSGKRFAVGGAGWINI